MTSPLGVAALVVNAILLFLVLFAPAIWGKQAAANDILNLGAGPGLGHAFGTDALGRDILARVLVASQLSIGLALGATAIGMFIGAVIGSVAAITSSRLRWLITGFIDIMVAFPGLLLALFFAVIFGVGPRAAVFALGLAMAPSFARLTYTLAANIAGRDFVAAARTLGISRTRILFRHVLPNIGEPLIVNATLGASGSLLAFASLSFLGLGVQLPDYDWGKMLGDGLNTIYKNPLAALAPGLALVLAGLAFNLSGEAAAQLLGGRVAMSPSRARRLLSAAFDRGIVDSDATGARTAGAAAEAGEAAYPLGKATTTEAGETAYPLGKATTTKAKSADLVLRVEHLKVAIPLDETTVATPVRDVSFTVRRGEAVGIVGESGSGKTLTAMAVAQLLSPPVASQADVMVLAGQSLATLSPKALRRHLGTSLAMVFQDPMSSLNPTMRVGLQLAEYSREHQGAGRAQAWERAVDRLRAVRIPSPERRAKQLPHELSGGMRQRSMIALGLMGEPALIIADEPTTALDVTVQEQVLRLIDRARAEHGAALLLISHDLAVVTAMCDRVLVMYAGKIVESIGVTDLVAGPAHPYTRGLIATSPDLGSDRDHLLPSIPGRPPHPGRLPVGCAFASRCPFATAVCEEIDPQLNLSTAGGQVACHHPQSGSVVKADPAGVLS